MSDARAGVGDRRERSDEAPAAAFADKRPAHAVSGHGGAAERFPDEVVVALHESGVTVGCLPVRIDDDDWRAALFYVVPPDAPCLVGPGRPYARGAASVARRPDAPAGPGSVSSRGDGVRSNDAAAPAPGDAVPPRPPPARLAGAPFAVALEADLHEHPSATVVELGIEIRTPGAPLVGSVLFLTGHASAHFDALTLLASQSDLPLFVGDEYCRVLARQRVPLGDAERGVFRSLLDEAVGRDAIIRLGGHYDARRAFDDVLRGG